MQEVGKKKGVVGHCYGLCSFALLLDVEVGRSVCEVPNPSGGLSPSPLCWHCLLPPRPPPLSLDHRMAGRTLKGLPLKPLFPIVPFFLFSFFLLRFLRPFPFPRMSEGLIFLHLPSLPPSLRRMENLSLFLAFLPFYLPPTHFFLRHFLPPFLSLFFPASASVQRRRRRRKWNLMPFPIFANGPPSPPPRRDRLLYK